MNQHDKHISQRTFNSKVAVRHTHTHTLNRLLCLDD